MSKTDSFLCVDIGFNCHVQMMFLGYPLANIYPLWLKSMENRYPEAIHPQHQKKEEDILIL